MPITISLARNVARCLLVPVLLSGIGFRANATSVTFAGFAYAGQWKSIPDRFKYTDKYNHDLHEQGGIQGLIARDLKSLSPAGYTLTTEKIATLAETSEAIAVLMVITNEVVSTEKIGSIYKLLVNIRGQALFFEFKQQTILRAYPFSFAYIDNSTVPQSEADKEADVALVYWGAGGKPGLISRFEQALVRASLPTNVSKSVRVSAATVEPDALSRFPDEFKDGAGNWVADMLSESIADKAGIAILPFALGDSKGKLIYTVSDSTVYNLDIPDADYTFSVNLTNLRIVPYEVQAAGRSLIYASYATILIEEPTSHKVFLNAAFKNGEVKVVPASQTNTDDFPAFQDSVHGLFVKFSDAVMGNDSTWVKAATTSPDIDGQLKATRVLLNSCK